jgi:hypothetical protein
MSLALAELGTKTALVWCGPYEKAPLILLGVLILTVQEKEKKATVEQMIMPKNPSIWQLL